MMKHMALAMVLAILLKTTLMSPDCSL